MSAGVKLKSTSRDPFSLSPSTNDNDMEILKRSHYKGDSAYANEFP